jgi:DNA modification methylase
MDWCIEQARCEEALPKIPSSSVDAIITDPQYPEIDRDYGRMTEAQWWDMMMVVCREARRILKPAGSAVFVLQPNSKHVGQMRGWLWEFMAWVCREWNMVQDVWWWNFCAMPGDKGGLCRSSIKANVWCGAPGCFRDDTKVLWSLYDGAMAKVRSRRMERDFSPSGHSIVKGNGELAAMRRGGSTPFNVIPMASVDHNTDGHGARTPLELAKWWVRYIVPSGGVVLDPFFGEGTMGIAALGYSRSIIGIEKEAKYCDTARRWLKQYKQAKEVKLDGLA